MGGLEPRACPFLPQPCQLLRWGRRVKGKRALLPALSHQHPPLGRAAASPGCTSVERCLSVPLRPVLHSHVLLPLKPESKPKPSPSLRAAAHCAEPGTSCGLLSFVSHSVQTFITSSKAVFSNFSKLLVFEQIFIFAVTDGVSLDLLFSCLRSPLRSW